MKLKRKLNIVAAVAGVALGPFSLAAARASQPPITWNAIGIIILGSLLGGLFVLGIQILRKNPKYGKFALMFFEPISIFIIGSGIGGLVYSIYLVELGPPSALFLAIGFGLFLSVVVSTKFYRSRFESSL